MGCGENPQPFFLMDPITLMALMSILTTGISSLTTLGQQDKEFNQQQQLQQDAQQFQAEREDIMYQRNSAPNQMQQMIDAGFNPVLAANSILGGNGVAAASSDSSPSAPTVNSAIGALSSMIGQGGQNLYDLAKNDAQIQNIHANTEKTQMETGILPRDYYLREMSVTEQIRVWDASVEKTKAAQKLDEEQTKLLQQQNLYYGRVTEAQINLYKGQLMESYNKALLALEQIDTEEAKQRELDTQSGLNIANTNVANKQADLIVEETGTQRFAKQREKIAMQFEQELGGIPLSADAQKYVARLAKDGNVEAIKSFYLNIFQTSLNQSIGENLGSNRSKISLPFGIYSREFPNPALRAYGSVPIWNPQP